VLSERISDARLSRKSGMGWQIEFANQIANQLCDTFRYQPSPAGIIAMELANRNERLALRRHTPARES